MSAIDLEIKRAEAVDQVVNGFKGNVRGLDVTNFEVGDVFTFPKEYKVFERDLNGTPVQYILVECENGTVKQFFPSSMWKARAIYNDNGKPTGKRAKASGKVVEKAQEFATVQEAMDALKDNKVKITAVTPHQVMGYNRTLATTTFLTIDFA